MASSKKSSERKRNDILTLSFSYVLIFDTTNCKNNIFAVKKTDAGYQNNVESFVHFVIIMRNILFSFTLNHIEKYI